MASKPMIVAAIDFGTTFSSWAFSFKHEFERDPTKMTTKNWTGGGQVSSKGPTCVLIKPDGKTVHTFGYEAERKYVELAADGKHGDWYFFKRFKMSLFNKELSRNDELTDEGGKRLPSKTVFSLSIKYLKDDLIKTSNKQISGGGLLESDILWVLTVPAIWNDAAKQMMREAAQEAGITENRLMIALEPEAASLLCRYLKVEQCGGKDTLASFGDGRRYLVLDAGGGTVDITVHEVVKGGYLKELQKASGGDWCGTNVDKEFLDFLKEIVGADLISRFKNDFMEDYLDLLNGFEVKKREINPDMESSVTFRLPATFNTLVREVKDQSLDNVVKTCKYSSQINLFGDKLRVDLTLAKAFFYPSINSVLGHLKSLLQDLRSQDVEAILMVGGFSESPMLQKSVEREFPKLKIIIPQQAGLAVLMGAVIFGHAPSMISARVSKFTYGTDVVNRSTDRPSDDTSSVFNPLTMLSNFNPFRNRKQNLRCAFSKLATAGQLLKVGEEQNEMSYTPVYRYASAIGMDIYATQHVDPQYVDDPGCYKLGTFIVPISGSGTDRAVKVRMIFGGTEIEVKCTEVATGKTTRLKVDFLT